MSMITTEILADIPYLDHATVPGRFLSCLTFYDEDWHFWVLAGEAGNTKLMKMKAWPAEAVSQLSDVLHWRTASAPIV